MNYFTIEDTEAGKFLDLVVAGNGDIALIWHFSPDNVKPIVDTVPHRNLLEKIGLCKQDYLWHECDQQGRWV